MIFIIYTFSLHIKSTPLSAITKIYFIYYVQNVLQAF